MIQSLNFKAYFQKKLALVQESLRGPMSTNSLESRGKYTIHQCFKPDDDWFQVHLVYEEDTTKMFLDRVIMWAVVDAPGKEPRLDAITDDGTPNAIFRVPEGDYYFVKASDKSPSGKKWTQLYEELTPSLLGVREISAEEAFKISAE